MSECGPVFARVVIVYFQHWPSVRASSFRHYLLWHSFFSCLASILTAFGILLVMLLPGGMVIWSLAGFNLKNRPVYLGCRNETPFSVVEAYLAIFVPSSSWLQCIQTRLAFIEIPFPDCRAVVSFLKTFRCFILNYGRLPQRSYWLVVLLPTDDHRTRPDLVGSGLTAPTV